MPKINGPEKDPVVQTEVDVHFQGVCRFWTPCAAAYKGLGQTYVDATRGSGPTTTRSPKASPSISATRWPSTPTPG